MVARSVAEAVERLGLRGRTLVVACSGGIDSTVLADALHQAGLDLRLGHVNHGLRGAEADADAEFVRAFAEARGLPVEVARVAPQALREGRSSRERPTLQEAARRARYDALACMGDGPIATAHTLDDQAETVLLRLLRGAGPDGLAGIPEVSGRVVRPLLRVPRAEIEAYARRRGLRWREDSSNRSPAYARNRLRGWLRRLEADFNPRLLRAIGDLAEAQQRDREWIADLVAREAAARFEERPEGLVIEAKDWNGLPVSLQRRLAREALRRVGAARDVSRAHLGRVTAFLAEGRPGTRIELPGGLELVRERGSCLLRAKLRG